MGVALLIGDVDEKGYCLQGKFLIKSWVMFQWEVKNNIIKRHFNGQHAFH